MSRLPERVARPASLAGRSVWAVLRARPIASLGLLLATLYLPWITRIPIDGTLEGNRLQAAREMLRSGDWLVPTLGGSLYLAKPPLHPWTLALVSLPLGEVHLATGRILSAIATLVACGFVLAWARRELGTRAGLCAAFALGLSVPVAQKSVTAELECELLLFTTLALLAFWDASRAGSRGEAARLRVLSGLALGGAVLVKGPPALIVFVPAALATGIPRANRRNTLVSAATVLGIGLACAAGWVVPLGARVGSSSAWAAFREQFLERIGDAGRTNAEPVWFYLPALLLALMPAASLGPCLQLVLPGRPERDRRSRARRAFLWGWAVGPVVLLSLSSGKETRYLLPTLPAWTLLLSWGWIRARASSRYPRWRRGLARAAGIATWAAPVVWLVGGSIAYPESLATVVLGSAGALVARAGFAWTARARRPAIAFGLLLLGVGIGKATWAGTTLDRKRTESPVEEVSRAIRAGLVPGETWILIGPYRSWWDFSVNRPCRAVADWSELREERAREPGARSRLVLSRDSAVPPAEESLDRVGRWTVDGVPYSLLLLPP